MNIVKSIRNFIGVPATVEKKKGDISSNIFKTTLTRTKQDICTWRESIREAEQEWYPHRVKMMRLFQDTILNGHVEAVMTLRKELTLLKDFIIAKENGEEDEEWTKFFKSQWFTNFLDLVLDGIFFGYSLIQIQDIIDNKISGVKIVKRENTSPDRHSVATFQYSIDGTSFYDEQYADWLVYVSTPNPTGSSVCGFGLLYKIAFCEIFLRNTIGNNADFVELFAQPYRIGRTNTRDEAMRSMMEETLRDMGSSGYAVIDPDDQIELLESQLGGNGYKSYDAFQDRLEKTISKIVLGHGSAVDATEGKLGNNDEAIKAIENKEKKDNQFAENIVNDQLIPKLRNLGFAIPEGYTFQFKNDKEKEEQRLREDESNQATATIVKTLCDAGFEVSPEYILERTGIPVEKKKEPEPEAMGKPIQKGIKNKLDQLYGIQ
jgi:phage gp29-like protein